MGMGFNGNKDDVNKGGNQVGTVTVGTTAVELRIGGSDYVGRQTLVVYNDSNKIIYLGDSGVTTSTGQPLFPRQRAYINHSDKNRTYAITTTAGNTLRLWESK